MNFLQTLFQGFSFNNFLLNFMSVVYEALPFIVLGAVISGLLEELLPQKFFTRLLPKRRLPALMISSLLGFLLPMCECGIVPVMRRLMKKGVPASCAITYMLSAPIINPIVLLSTAYAFSGSMDVFGVYGLGMVLLRAGFAFITAVSLGVLIDRLVVGGEQVSRENVSRDRIVQSEESLRLVQVDLGLVKPDCCNDPDHEHHHHHDHAHHHHDHEHGKEGGCDHDHDHDDAHDHGHQHHDHAHGSAPKRTLLQRLQAIADIALGDFLDIAAFLTIGALLTATVNSVLDRQKLVELTQYPPMAIGAMMGLAILLSLCSEADAFVAANFVGLDVSAKLGFLVLGPMLDMKLFIMYSWVFSRRTVRTLVASLIVIIFSLCMLYHYVLGPALATLGSSSS